MSDLGQSIIRELVRHDKKTIKQDVIDVVEASSTEKEFATFMAFIKEHNIKVVG